MTLLRPCGDASVSDGWQDHKNRPNGGSSEPGTDYAVPRGTAVLAAGNGKVVDAKYTTSSATGRYVTVDLDNGQRVRYLHLDSILKGVGSRVTQGEIIARSGVSGFGSNTGYGPHVHVTLWPFQRYQFGQGNASGTLDFHAHSSANASSQDTKNRQSWLNKSRGENLTVDGIQGPATTAAIKRYQTFLRNSYGYKGGVDGIWGSGTQAAHQKFYDAYNKPASGGGSSSTPPETMLKWKWNGIQEMLRGTGRYRGAIDNKPGSGTVSGFQDFLNDFGYANLKVDGVFGVATCKGAQQWLKRKWGYTGAIDGIPGSGTKAAWDRAEKANADAF